MPELPDVETYRLYLNATSLHQTIRRVHVDQPAIVRGTTPQGLGRRLDGHRMERTRRHGKYLFAALDGNAGALVFHFGMTGALKYFRSTEDTPQYTDVRLDFARGFHLAYIAPRKLGMVTVVQNIDEFIAEEQLGPDALQLDWPTFQELAAGRRGGVKSWLMDQRVMAGIGNIYSDEILFQARLHPRRSVKDLNANERKVLFEKMHSVLHTAIEAQADPERLPGSWLLPHRDTDGHCPECGTRVASVQAAGRTAYLCPRCQPQSG